MFPVLLQISMMSKFASAIFASSVSVYAYERFSFMRSTVKSSSFSFNRASYFSSLLALRFISAVLKCALPLWIIRSYAASSSFFGGVWSSLLLGYSASFLAPWLAQYYLLYRGDIVRLYGLHWSPCHWSYENVRVNKYRLELWTLFLKGFLKIRVHIAGNCFDTIHKI